MRRSPTAFTRRRTLTLPHMAALTMSGMCTSAQAKLDALFGALGDGGGRTRTVSAQASARRAGGSQPNCANWPAAA
ncbi:hypothetical protein PQR05_37885 [Paraburkholderia sediminicola]|uniref:hypothetical protein n=1 Tax=Paraburkholderia sediminicola TaxID=458836 RepID=UPI0038BD155D